MLLLIRMKTYRLIARYRSLDPIKAFLQMLGLAGPPVSVGQRGCPRMPTMDPINQFDFSKTDGGAARIVADIDTRAFIT